MDAAAARDASRSYAPAGAAEAPRRRACARGDHRPRGGRGRWTSRRARRSRRDRPSASAWHADRDALAMAVDSSTVAISLEDVSKSFGAAAAVKSVSFTIRRGEFFSLLGPSGCGKTTTLRMIAGFETPDAGRIVLEGADVTAVSANRRPVNMVFQQYALFPHMSIYDNVAFGLKVKRIPRQDHRERVREILRIVELEGLESRRPRQLS